LVSRSVLIWNFSFDAAKHKNFISASFMEFVLDGPQ
jgi:hypothetical protein